MAPQLTLVQYLNENDRQLAESVLGKHGPVSTTPVQVRGYADEEDVRALEERGLIVEQVPAEPTLSWLEPDAQEELPPEMLADDSGPRSPIQEAAAAAPRVYLIQMEGPLLAEWRQRLDQLGVELLRRVPEFAFTAALTDEQLAAVQNLPFVVRVPEYDARLTLRRLSGVMTRTEAQEPQPSPPGQDAALESSVIGAAQSAAETAQFELRCHNPKDLPQVAEAMAHDPRIQEVEVIGTKIRFRGENDQRLLGELGAMPQVSVVDRQRVAELSVTFARAAIGVEWSKPAPGGGSVVEALPWDGTGGVVGVADTGVEHPDLQPRLAEAPIPVGDPDDLNDPVGHGTHVCGIIAAVAPGVRLLVQSVRASGNQLTGLPDRLNDLFQQVYDRGVRIHNNSWGFPVKEEKANWTPDSAEVEEFVYQHPDFLVVFAAGNTGMQPDPLPQGDVVGSVAEKSINSPSTAKNCLAVGACCSPRGDGPYEGLSWSQYRPPRFRHPQVAQEPICGDPDCLAAFSSRGPVDDNRVKPDLLAPGTAILSTRSEASQPEHPFPDPNGRQAYMSGTSMAAPVVTGAAAIVRQYYVQERGHASPSAALLKATLINGTVPISRTTAGTARPNVHQGYGRLDLRRTLPLPNNPEGFRLLFVDVARESPQALHSQDSQRVQWRRDVHVAAGLPLRVTLAWTDLPEKGLQQDLDLTVVTPGGTQLLGNADWPKPVPTHKRDHTNNVEQVVIEAPETGEYRILVVAFETWKETQGFSLVVTGKLESDLLP
jgi:serine protease AprX